MSETFIRLSRVSASVRLGNGDSLTTVKEVSFCLAKGRSYSLVGKSGSGKTSLISILGLLNQDFQGSYEYEGREIQSLTDRERSKIRASSIGFVFQNYSLIHHLKVWENIELALAYSKFGSSLKDRRQRVNRVLEAVGLANRRNDRPNRLSGGEQQRVAIARALVTAPSLIVCDEPTGALDSETSAVVIALLKSLVAEQGATLFLVTHDEEFAASCDTVMRMDRGEVVDVQNAS